jgi:hypothetical protein
MATYNVSIIEALAGWGAGTWGQGVWGLSTEPTDTQVYALTIALDVTENITLLADKVTNGQWYPEVIETVTATESMTNVSFMNQPVNESVTPTDTITYNIPWAAIDSSSTPNWTQITVP